MANGDCRLPIGRCDESSVIGFGFESIGNWQLEIGNHGCAASLSFARFSTSAAVTGNHTETHPVNRGTLPV
jgi:hypothetical protein